MEDPGGAWALGGTGGQGSKKRLGVWEVVRGSGGGWGLRGGWGLGGLGGAGGLGRELGLF